ncbi:DUF3576 domain-containing protein [Ferruginivarius sediminum]|uniref:DUF3576 domain-containing protein n=1 Tax=Ferruginivarius sediminum TaxID=2661937 RepID=A0A369TEI3_9PROT|nr:DUF3576 domain-containing protein [Ferruginivarius sediminum]RDD63252.1 DUF3576 domain-containing protein [Ferruginivarius sediminum]
MNLRRGLTVLAVAFLGALAACGPSKDKSDPLTTREIKTSGDPEVSPQERFGSVTGNSLSNLFGSGDGEGQGGGGGGGIGVNAYLWRASLDTVSFMPLASADPFGGVIITDWYSPPDSPNERFKVNLYILGRQLRADGLRASVFRQQRAGDGSWQDASVEQKTATQLENAILTRARQMRIASLQ